MRSYHCLRHWQSFVGGRRPTHAACRYLPAPCSDSRDDAGAGLPRPARYCLPQHDDTGWQVTVDQYFFNEVYYVVDTVVDQLLKDPKRHFIYVETGFFARWWDEQPDARRNVTKALVENGQLEFINGAWCMHDEARRSTSRWWIR